MSNISDTSITVGNKIIVHLAKIPCIKLFVGICYIYIYIMFYIYLMLIFYLYVCIYMLVILSHCIYLNRYLTPHTFWINQTLFFCSLLSHDQYYDFEL